MMHPSVIALPLQLQPCTDAWRNRSSALVRPEPYSLRATTTSSHPQLRDLLVHTPEDGPAGAVFTACYDSLCSVDCYASVRSPLARTGVYGRC